MIIICEGSWHPDLVAEPKETREARHGRREILDHHAVWLWLTATQGHPPGHPHSALRTASDKLLLPACLAMTSLSQNGHAVTNPAAEMLYNK